MKILKNIGMAAISMTLILTTLTSCKDSGFLDINYNPNSSPKTDFHQWLEKNQEAKEDYSVVFISTLVVIVSKESKTERNKGSHRLIEPVIRVNQAQQKKGCNNTLDDCCSVILKL